MSIDERRVYDHIRSFYRFLLAPFLTILVREGIHSNFLSFVVFFSTLGFVFFVFTGNIIYAGCIGIVIAASDILGALIAEDLGEKNTTRALLDSIMDRYSEILFYTCIIVLFFQADDLFYALFAYLALIGASMCSFIRVRAEQFGVDSNFGFVQRPERFLILSLSMFCGLTGLAYASVVIAVVANGTAIYLITRIWYNKK